MTLLVSSLDSCVEKAKAEILCVCTGKPHDFNSQVEVCVGVCVQAGQNDAPGAGIIFVTSKRHGTGRKDIEKWHKNCLKNTHFSVAECHV